MRDSPSFDKFGYWPNTPSQWREATVDDCTWYAGEFAFEAADIQHRNYNPVKDIREKSADNTGGTTVEYMTRFMYNWWPSDALLNAYYGSFTEERIIDMLEKGCTFIVGGDYEELPVHYRRWTYNDKFNHAVAIRFYDANTERTAMYDPLGGGREMAEYDGEWISLTALLKGYWWRGGSGWVAGVVGPYREERVVRPYIVPEQANKELRAKARSFVYNGPSAVSPVERRIWSENNWWPYIARAAGGWFLILWYDPDRPEIVRHGYIHIDDVIERRNRATEPTDPDLVAQVSNLQTEVDRLKGINSQQLAVINAVRTAVK